MNNVEPFIGREPQTLRNVDYVAWRIKNEKERVSRDAVRRAYAARPRLRAANH